MRRGYATVRRAYEMREADFAYPLFGDVAKRSERQADSGNRGALDDV